MTRRRVRTSTSEVELALRAHEMKASKGPTTDRDPRDLPPAHGTVVDPSAPKPRRGSLWWRFRWWWRYGWGGRVR